MCRRLWIEFRIIQPACQSEIRPSLYAAEVLLDLHNETWMTLLKLIVTFCRYDARSDRLNVSAQLHFTTMGGLFLGTSNRCIHRCWGRSAWRCPNRRIDIKVWTFASTWWNKDYSINTLLFAHEDTCYSYKTHYLFLLLCCPRVRGGAIFFNTGNKFRNYHPSNNDILCLHRYCSLPKPATFALMVKKVFVGAKIQARSILMTKAGADGTPIARLQDTRWWSRSDQRLSNSLINNNVAGIVGPTLFNKL